MTDGNLYYQEFMSILQDKIPNKTNLVNTITDILVIDKDAVYRRLRGEVNFSFAEMATIARKLGISLDDIVGIYISQSRPASILICKYVNPTEIDFRMFNDYVNLLKSIRDESDTKLIESLNLLPYFLFYDYEYITRFSLFAWNMGSSLGNSLPFHEIIISERMRILQKACSMYARDIKNTTYLFDYMTFKYMVANISYFAKTRLIDEENVILIKNDLLMFLNNLEKLAIAGKYEETGNKVSLYVSDVNFTTNYTLIESKNVRISQIKAYLLNAVNTLDDKVFNETKAWLSSMQKKSTLISVSGEKIRASFFDKQRKIINAL